MASSWVISLLGQGQGWIQETSLKAGFKEISRGGLSRYSRRGSVGVLTVVAVSSSYLQHEVSVGLSGHICDSEHIMSADCVRRVRAVRDGTSDAGSSFACLKWHSVPIQ